MIQIIIGGHENTKKVNKLTANEKLNNVLERLAILDEQEVKLAREHEGHKKIPAVRAEIRRLERQATTLETEVSQLSRRMRVRASKNLRKFADALED